MNIIITGVNRGVIVELQDQFRSTNQFDLGLDQFTQMFEKFLPRKNEIDEILEKARKDAESQESPFDTRTPRGQYVFEDIGEAVDFVEKVMNEYYS